MSFHRKPNTYVGQVNLKVQNLERALKFYQDIIGFQVLEQTEQTANLTADGKKVLLSIEQPDSVVPMQGRTTGLYHFALLLPTRSDLAQIVQHLANSGQRFGSSDHLVSEALYLSDPDGNGIEIYRDRDPSEWEWKNGEVKMTVDPLDFRDLLSGINQQQEWKGLPADTVMGHIHLHVSELAKTEEFYCKGLGFEVVNRFGAQALFISTGNYHHHIGLNTWNGVGAPKPPENSVGLQSFTLLYPDAAARDRAVANLQSIGASVAEGHGGYTTSDPSGNRILLLV
ncbi:catechol-2,3-dioxygenase [Paenibacillus sp. J31TS4]|uniref:VOC family protein n=1 Tax=Paenibacillus sp. J31TS4 TaxID=2807195 RepID=UPI001B0E371A|nr:VOC family protein [Paenibacillus sp. J31TS4]GIP39012.1 catechol-2,3-dioxygenase [Paenibacillus sp. J31TS4]